MPPWRTAQQPQSAKGASPSSSSLYMQGTSFVLYARAAELGYEVAQSNAAWLLGRLGRQGALGPQRRDPGATLGSTDPASAGSPLAGRATALDASGAQVVDADAGGGVGSAPALPIPGVSAGAACVGPLGYPCTVDERQARAHRLWKLASEQGNVQATLLVGDAFFYGRGVARSLEKAVEAYTRAKDEKPPSAQACFNLGFMHERGLGLPPDLHLAKRYYDLALEVNPHAALPVTLALAALWVRTHHPHSILVRGLDVLPDVALRLTEATGLALEHLQDDGNKALLTLLAALAAVLFLRAKLRRGGMPPQPLQPQQQQQVVPGAGGPGDAAQGFGGPRGVGGLM